MLCVYASVYINVTAMVELLTFRLSLSVSLNLLWQSMAAAESGLFDEQLISPLIRKLQDDSASSLPLQEYGKKVYEMTLDEPNLKKKKILTIHKKMDFPAFLQYMILTVLVPLF